MRQLKVFGLVSVVFNCKTITSLQLNVQMLGSFLP